MKRISAIILILGIAISAFAGNVSEKRAESLAKLFFGSTATRGTEVLLDMVWDGTDGVTRSGEAPAFYVFNRRGGGFVVIAGEDAAVPVLGYSETGSFNAAGIQPNVRGWFEMYAREVEFMRGKGILPDGDTRQLWEDSSVKEILHRAGGRSLNTRSWGQDAPFNQRCPVVDGLPSVTGCVATAIGEVMCYHRWPESVSGNLPSYSYRTDRGLERTQMGHRLDTTYNWSQMPMNCNTYTSEQAQNVSRLLYDVAVMVQSRFNGVGKNASGTASVSEMIVPMMVKYMDYDSSAVLLYRDNYSTLRWTEMLKAEIDASRPVLYAGDDNVAGHQFVIDGYDSSGKFRINWGWDGIDNGFFAVSSFRIDADYDFRYNQSGVFGLKKNESGAPATPQVFYYEKQNNKPVGIFLKSGSVESGSFVMSTGAFYNFGAFRITADFAFLLLDYADNPKSILSEVITATFESEAGTAVNADCVMSPAVIESLSFGDKIALCYRIGGGEWTRITVDAMSNPGPGDYPICDFPCIRVNGTATYQASDYIPLEIVNTRTVPSSVSWFIDGSAYSDTEVKLQPGDHTLKCIIMVGGVTQILVQQIKVTP